MEKPKELPVLISSFPGLTINVPARDNEPIQFIMDRVTNKLSGTEIGNSLSPRLYIDGKLIEDFKKSMQYYSLFGQVLTYESDNNNSNIINSYNHNGEKSLQIFVLGLSGKPTKYNLCSKQTICNVKQAIQYKEGMPVDEQLLIYRKKILDDNYTLADYNIANYSTVNLSLRLRGGNPFPMFQFANVSDINNRLTLKTVDHAPRGRQCTRGVNIEIQCKCTPYYRVVHCYGFGIFEIGGMLTSCPNCGSYGTPLTTGLYECYYRVFGVKQDGTRYKSDWIRVGPEDEYQYYNPNEQIYW